MRPAVTFGKSYADEDIRVCPVYVELRTVGWLCRAVDSATWSPDLHLLDWLDGSKVEPDTLNAMKRKIRSIHNERSKHAERRTGV